MKYFDSLSKRSSGIELLRCLLMMMIIYLHLLIHGVNGEFTSFNGNKVLPTTFSEAFTSIFCMVAVDAFVIISGFYGINISDKGDKINLRKILKNYKVVLFYSVSITLIFFFFKKATVMDLALSIFPVITGKWWFASCYIALVFISPFLNCIIEKYWNNKYFYAILILIVLCTYFLEGRTLCSLYGLQSLGFSTVVVCYILGRILSFFAKENKKFVNQKSLFYFLGYVCCCLISFAGTVFLYILTKKNYWFRVSIYCSPLTLLGAIFLFLAFLNSKIKHNQFINLLGTTTFGIYLIHENPLIRPVLYELINAQRFKNIDDESFLFVYLACSVFCVFLTCSIIDFIRSILFYFTSSVISKKINYKGD